MSKDIEENLKQRTELYNKSLNDPALCALILEKCHQDPVFWIDYSCWTYNPREKNKNIPFISYPFQEQAINNIVEYIKTGEDTLIEKTREMGVTWLVLYIFEWFWQFKQGYTFLVSGKVEDDIDKQGVIDTLFEKLRFNLRLQPKYLLPADFDLKTDLLYMRIINKNCDSAIHGHAPGADLGRSGRNSAVLLDEFASWDHNKAMGSWTALADTTPCRIVVSTPRGSGNKFARLAKGLDKEKVNKITLHWTLHPIKAINCYYLNEDEQIPVPFLDANRLWTDGKSLRSPWYDKECERRTKEDIAQELDIDYLKSGRPYFDQMALLRQKPAIFDRVRFVETQKKIHVRLEEDGLFKIYEAPRKIDQYVVGADTSEGLPKGDMSFGVVRSKLTLDVCATINGLFSPEDFAYYLYLLSRYFNEAKIACELNNHGYTTNLKLFEIGANLYYTQTGQNVSKRGFLTSVKTKPIMLDRMSNHITTSLFKLRDETLIQQCETFVRKDSGKLEADGDFLDDGVMACAIAGQAIEEEPYKNKQFEREYMMRDKVLNVKNAGFGDPL